METFEPTRQFDFTQVYLDTQPVQGGTFFTKLYNADKNPLYIQMPKCVSKQGVVTTKGPPIVICCMKRTTTNP